MVEMSPIVEKRKRRSVRGRRVNGLHMLSFVCSERPRLAGAPSGESAVFL